MTAAARRPDGATLKRWREHLANERAEAATYRAIAGRRQGEEREILLALAEAERRHEQHWLDLLGDEVGPPARVALRTRLLGWLARVFGTVFVLALIQSAEARSTYADDPDATPEMAADEQVHEEVVRALAERGRHRISGTFRAAVFGANDGLVSNLSLILGVGATGVAPNLVLIAGIAGLLAGAMSMAAGEYVSVHSQRELLEASTPNPNMNEVVSHLDIDANELALVYRSRGMSEVDAAQHARTALSTARSGAAAPQPNTARGHGGRAHEALGTGMSAAISSFCFFASGAAVPILPYLFGMTGLPAVIVASALVGVVLLGTGAVVGLLSGAPPLKRALRQLAIGFGAAAVTYVLGLVFGATLL